MAWAIEITRCVAVAMVLACATPASAQRLLPIGADTVVSADAAIDQTDPLVLAAPGDAVVVLWRSASEIRGRGYDAAGTPTFATTLQGLGGPFAAAAAGAGGFAVAAGAIDGPGLLAQRYTWAGEPRWPQPTAVGDRGAPAYFPSLAATEEGRCLVVWMGGEVAPPTVFPTDVFAQSFAGDGTPLSEPVRLNLIAQNGLGLPAAAAGEDGGAYLVVWSAVPAGAEQARIYGTMVAADGPPGPPFEIPSEGRLYSWPTVTRVGARFLVVWTAAPPGGARGRLLDASGTPLGQELALVPGDGFAGTSTHGVAPLADGFLLGWTTFGQPLPRTLVHARRFDANGQPLGPAVQVNAAPLESNTFVAVAADSTGGFVAAWEADSLHPPDPILARRVVVCGDGARRGEACDDGNAVDGDGCDSNCTVTACGNGIRTGGETCDDGNLVDGDGCSAGCQVQSTHTPTITATPTVTPTPRSAFDITGCVPHATSGCGFEFGSVTLEPSGRVAAVDGGAFRFADVPPGTYTLTYSPACNPFGCRPPAMATVVDDDVYVQFRLVRPCPGDCANDGSVTIDDAMACVAAALNGRSGGCAACDGDRDGRVAIHELIDVVRNALFGCPAY